MGKKTIVILFVCVMALACVYAESSSAGVLELSVIPSSFQMIKVEEDVYSSTDGFGAYVGYMYNVWKGLSVGASLEWSNYKQEKLLSYGSFNNIAILARFSYRLGLSEKVFADAGLGLGYEMTVVGENISNSFITELNGNFGIIIDDVFSLAAGATAKAAIQKTTKVYSVLPTIGVGISL